MGLLLTTVVGLCAWIVLWALGFSGFDAFLIVPVLVLVVVMMRVMPTGRRGKQKEGARPQGGWRRVPDRASSEGDVGDRGALMARAWAAGVVLTAIGSGLWIAALVTTNDVPARLSDLGAALLGGAVVAFAVFFLERLFEQRAELQNLRLRVGLQQDLRQADLRGQELSGMIFNGKDLSGTDFSGAKLRRVAFLHATLTGAKFVDTDLTDTVFTMAKLDGATFALAEITGAIFTEAIDVDKADFEGAWHQGDRNPQFKGMIPKGIRREDP